MTSCDLLNTDDGNDSSTESGTKTGTPINLTITNNTGYQVTVKIPSKARSPLHTAFVREDRRCTRTAL